MRNGIYGIYKHRKHIALILVLAACLLAGCSAASSIREDSVHEDLPVIDPDAGIANDTSATLYYRLVGEPYLAGVSASVHMGASERVETAIIRGLLAGTPEGISGIEPLFPEGTAIVDVSLSGGILYVTLSSNMLTASGLEADEARMAAAAALESEGISAEEYAAEVERIDSELYTKRRLAVCSLVNAVTEYNPNVRVQLLIDTQDSGAGVRVKAGELGLADVADTALLEPQEFNADVVAQPETIVSSVLEHLINGEHERAYALLADTAEETAKPSLGSFTAQLAALCKLTGYEILGSTGRRDIFVSVRMSLLDAAGLEQTVERRLVVVQENGMYRLSCVSLLAGLEGTA